MEKRQSKKIIKSKLQYVERKPHQLELFFSCGSSILVELEFGNVVVFVEGGKPENPEKNPRSKGENQQQTQPKYRYMFEFLFTR